MDRGGTRSMLNTNFEKEELEGNSHKLAFFYSDLYYSNLTLEYKNCDSNNSTGAVCVFACVKHYKCMCMYVMFYSV